jgi:hypothetical protein
VVAALAWVIASRLPATDNGLTAEQRTMVLKLQSVLLHDSPNPQYARVSQPPDGRGYVTGIGDFATADGSALKVIDAYTARVGPNVLARDYATTLGRLAETGSTETAELDGYPDAWRTASLDPVFRQVQDNVLQADYLAPAIELAGDQGVHSPLGIAVFLDSLLLHGMTGPDSLPVLIARTEAAYGKEVTDSIDEREWVRTFLDVRKAAVGNPADPAHRQWWPLTVGRVDALADLVRRDAWELTSPVLVSAYGTTHVLDAKPPQLDLPPIALPTEAPPQPAEEPTTTEPTPGTPATSRSGPPPASGPATVSPLPREGAIIGIEGLCLDLEDAVPEPNRHIKTWLCNQTAAQYWYATVDEQLMVKGICIRPSSGSSAPGTKILSVTCSTSDLSQRWHFVDGRIRHAVSGHCLAVPDDITEPGYHVVLAVCADRPGQYWTMVS